MAEGRESEPKGLPAELGEPFQNAECHLEVDPSRGAWGKKEEDTGGGVGLEEGVWGHTAVWSG